VTDTDATSIESLREELGRVRHERDLLLEERDGARARVHDLERELAEVRRLLAEVLKLSDLQQADLDRLRTESDKAQPNRPERVPAKELDLAAERVVTSCGQLRAANDTPSSTDEQHENQGPAGEAPAAGSITKGQKKKRRHAHGRRRLDLAKLPIERVEIDPDEVRAAGGEGFVCIGEETSDRIAFKPGGFVCLRIVRRKWARVGAEKARDVDAESDAASTLPPPVIVAPVPDNVWPRVMADPSAVSRVIVGKYDDCLPLNRQENITAREGFVVPRSTQCRWLGAAYAVSYRVVDAMFAEGCREAFCMATDATGAPLRAPGGCQNWHIYVFIADRDHVVFRYTPENTSVAVEKLLHGFHGHLLSDAAAVYDVLHREHDVVEVGCWFHARRYFYRALESDRQRALEALAIIRELFLVHRECRDIPMPARTEARAARARPILAVLDRWIERNRDHVDPRSPLATAIGYYENQREALHRFLDDGRLRLDNNISEGALRKLVLGRRNWNCFANETGLRWYTVFRSLIASCQLHGLNPMLYLEQLLRLAPHWPVTRMIELAPKYWAKTIASLDVRMRAMLARPWEIDDVVASSSVADAA
jgi:transposase